MTSYIVTFVTISEVTCIILKINLKNRLTSHEIKILDVTFYMLKVIFKMTSNIVIYITNIRRHVCNIKSTFKTSCVIVYL